MFFKHFFPLKNVFQIFFSLKNVFFQQLMKKKFIKAVFPSCVSWLLIYRKKFTINISAKEPTSNHLNYAQHVVFFMVHRKMAYWLFSVLGVSWGRMELKEKKPVAISYFFFSKNHVRGEKERTVYRTCSRARSWTRIIFAFSLLSFSHSHLSLSCSRVSCILCASQEAQQVRLDARVLFRLEPELIQPPATTPSVVLLSQRKKGTCGYFVASRWLGWRHRVDSPQQAQTTGPLDSRAASAENLFMSMANPNTKSGKLFVFRGKNPRFPTILRAILGRGAALFFRGKIPRFPTILRAILGRGAAFFSGKKSPFPDHFTGHTRSGCSPFFSRKKSPFPDHFTGHTRSGCSFRTLGTLWENYFS